ncbi:MAG: N-acetyltransferase [Anaerolineae bacterium]|nr:N-acetyltransferase [Anaerolineae bacterium]
MDYTFRPVQDTDQEAFLNILNYFIEHSFAAYPDKKASSSTFEKFCESAKGYPFYVVEVDDGQVVGFGLLRPYHESATFAHTGVLTYFLLSDYVHRGIGSALFNRLMADAQELGMKILVAHISSKNQPSLNFHKKHGFIECGRLRDIGRKFGQSFDVVWVQKFLE